MGLATASRAFCPVLCGQTSWKEVVCVRACAHVCVCTPACTRVCVCARVHMCVCARLRPRVGHGESWRWREHWNPRVGTGRGAHTAFSVGGHASVSDPRDPGASLEDDRHGCAGPSSGVLAKEAEKVSVRLRLGGLARGGRRCELGVCGGAMLSAEAREGAGSFRHRLSAHSGNHTRTSHTRGARAHTHRAPQPGLRDGVDPGV